MLRIKLPDECNISGDISRKLYQLPGHVGENVHTVFMLFFRMCSALSRDFDEDDREDVRSLAATLQALSDHNSQSVSSVVFGLLRDARKVGANEDKLTAAGVLDGADWLLEGLEIDSVVTLAMLYAAMRHVYKKQKGGSDE